MKKLLQSPFFTCGWKPALTWICVAAAFENFVLSSLLEDVYAVMGCELHLSRLNAETVAALTASLLGLGGLHSYDNTRGASKGTHDENK